MRRILLVIMLIGNTAPAFAQTSAPKPAYDISLPREEKIKLAESAAPTEISGKATIYVLDQAGYVKVREGTNGFSCIVDRQSILNMEPTCFDAEGSSSTLLTRIFVEEQRAKGKSEEEINTTIEDGYKTGKFHRNLRSPPDSLDMPRVLRAGQPDAYIVVLPTTATPPATPH